MFERSWLKFLLPTTQVAANSYVTEADLVSLVNHSPAALASLGAADRAHRMEEAARILDKNVDWWRPFTFDELAELQQLAHAPLVTESAPCQGFSRPLTTVSVLRAGDPLYLGTITTEVTPWNAKSRSVSHSTSIATRNSARSRCRIAAG